MGQVSDLGYSTLLGVWEHYKHPIGSRDEDLVDSTCLIRCPDSSNLDKINAKYKKCRLLNPGEGTKY